MKKYFKKYALQYGLMIPFVLLAIIYPDASLVLEGGFAWFLLYVLSFFSIALTAAVIFGGSVVYESNGIRGWIRDRKKFKQEVNKEVKKVETTMKLISDKYPNVVYSEAFSDNNIYKYAKQEVKTRLKKEKEQLNVR